MHYQCKHERIELTLDETFEGKDLQDFFDRYDLSKKTRYLELTNGAIELNHEVTKNPRHQLKPGDLLAIRTPEEPLGFKPADVECPIVYEDDFVYVAHKDRGLIIHGEYDQQDTLATQAAAYQANHDINVPVRYIHRLDKDTVGLVLFVKIPFFQAWFDKQLSEKKIQRHYYAITTGKAKNGQHFIYNGKIGRDRHVAGKYRISETGVEALTRVECVNQKGPYLLMSCQLETGRTHQIRVHLSNSGHPIVNDPLYGVPAHLFSGMGLWADEIDFTNPVTGETCKAVDSENIDFLYFD
ncbi:MAG: RluA family pseudouridine synthase [Solobacterium sp.]|jgi:23S rRNA pseudouridine1911/1915/1917 synthase|nr:RluA family pseudouridine synthase [Solobacterium sp.]MCH4223194.1 RluA family pseudouridine synthase [Solobacterium sp.]MCH4266400.1 RluA family pseudouridine synthase [Solobacterium sp.]